MGFKIKSVTNHQKQLSKTNLNHFGNDKEDILRLWKIQLELENRPDLPVKTLYYITLIQFFFDKKDFLSKMTFLTFCIFALFFKFTFLYSLFLLDIVHHFDILNNLINAFTRNSK